MEALNYPFVVKLTDEKDGLLYIVNNEVALAKFALRQLERRMNSGHHVNLNNLQKELSELFNAVEITKENSFRQQILKDEILYQESLLELLAVNEPHEHEHESTGVKLSIYLFFLKKECSHNGFIIFAPSEIKKYRSNSHIIDLL